MAANVNLDSVIYTPTSTSDLQRMAERSRRLFGYQADLLVVTAGEFRRVLRHVHPGNPWLAGMDGRIAAGRVTKHMLRAAEMQISAAAEMVRMWNRYGELYLDAPKSGARPAFNVRG